MATREIDSFFEYKDKSGDIIQLNTVTKLRNIVVKDSPLQMADELIEEIKLDVDKALTLASSGQAGSTGNTFNGLFEQKDTVASVVRNADGISETVRRKSSGVLIATRDTTRTSDRQAITEVTKFYKEDGVTVDYEVTVTSVKNSDGSVSVTAV